MRSLCTSTREKAPLMQLKMSLGSSEDVAQPKFKREKKRYEAKPFLLEDRRPPLGWPSPLTLQIRAMRDTMVFSKNSNSWPISLKKK